MEKLNALDSFLSDENNSKKKDQVAQEQPKEEKKVIRHKDGLVERVDKIYVTNDGRQLLREVY
jgi:hypothetical protein